MPSTGNGRLPIRTRIANHRAREAGGKRRAGETPGLPAEGRHRWNEMLSSAAVILAGVILVIGFAFVASRAMRTHSEPPKVAVPNAPALGEVTVPSGAASQGLIPLQSPSSSPSPSPSSSSPSPSPSTTAPTAAATTTAAPDVGAVSVANGATPARVNLSAEGTRDWVHWGLQSTFSTERDDSGGFAILEGAPVAPRNRDSNGPVSYSWTGGSPVATSGGTSTGIHTCGQGNGFTLSAPAGTATRTLRLYVGVINARGKLTAKLSTGSAGGTTTLTSQGGIKTGLVTLTYHAPKDGKLDITWNTDATLGAGCGGVALQAATLR